MPPRLGPYISALGVTGIQSDLFCAGAWPHAGAQRAAVRKTRWTGMCAARATCRGPDPGRLPWQGFGLPCSSTACHAAAAVLGKVCVHSTHATAAWPWRRFQAHPKTSGPGQPHHRRRRRCMNLTWVTATAGPMAAIPRTLRPSSTAATPPRRCCMKPCCAFGVRPAAGTQAAYSQAHPSSMAARPPPPPPAEGSTTWLGRLPVRSADSSRATSSSVAALAIAAYAPAGSHGDGGVWQAGQDCHGDKCDTRRAVVQKSGPAGLHRETARMHCEAAWDNLRVTTGWAPCFKGRFTTQGA